MRISKYSLEPVGATPKFILTSVQGAVGNSDICNGSISFLGVVTWHTRQDFTFSSTIRSIFGNQTFSRTNALVLVIPMWPSWVISTTFSRSVSWTTIPCPLKTKSGRVHSSSLTFSKDWKSEVLTLGSFEMSYHFPIWTAVITACNVTLCSGLIANGDVVRL